MLKEKNAPLERKNVLSEEKNTPSDRKNRWSEEEKIMLD